MRAADPLRQRHKRGVRGGMPSNRTGYCCRFRPCKQTSAFLFFQKIFFTVDVGRWGCGDGKVQELFGPALWALSCRLVCGKKVRKLHLESPVFEFARELACDTQPIQSRRCKNSFSATATTCESRLKRVSRQRQKPWRTCARYPLGRTVWP
jgi:hypothetical protein